MQVSSCVAATGPPGHIHADTTAAESGDVVTEISAGTSPEMILEGSVEVEDEEKHPAAVEGKKGLAQSKSSGQHFTHPASARETMEIFELEGLGLDDALRLFLRDVRLVGETDARQRVIDLFALRYIDCNPKGFFTRGKRGRGEGTRRGDGGKRSFMIMGCVMVWAG